MSFPDFPPVYIPPVLGRRTLGGYKQGENRENDPDHRRDRAQLR